MKLSIFVHRLLHKTIIVLSLCLVSTCQNARKSDHAHIYSTTLRPDGSKIHWSLSGNNIENKNQVLLIAQGSGCAPARTSENVLLMASAAPEFSILTIEKYGVELPSSLDGSLTSCSQEFFNNHTITQRVHDAQTVFKDLDSRGLWNGKTVLFGGSEGGAVVSILSHALPETDAVIVFSTGTGLTMAEFFPMVVPPDFAKQMTLVFDDIRTNPNATGMAAGNSYKWWRDILDRRLSDDLLKSKVPILLVHGVNDKSGPVEAARATEAAFISAKKSDQLTYWEMKDRDHQMNDPEGHSHMEGVLKDVAGWIEQQ